MTDKNLHQYFALALNGLLPKNQELPTQLHAPDKHLSLLLDVYPFEPKTLIDYCMIQLNAKSGVELNRAYFWLKKYCTDSKLEYFILQHPSTGTSTMQREIYDARYTALHGNFQFSVGALMNLADEEFERYIGPLFVTFKVLYDLRVPAWWEDDYALTRADIDILIGYLRKAIQ